MRKFTLLLLSLFALTVHAQNPAAMAKSDSLFAAGVDLYRAGKFQEAIPLFTESDRIDKAVLDSTSNRRDYSSMWLAACLYQLGDTARAAALSKLYKEAPVDRRLTVKSDSLSNLGMRYFAAGDLRSALPIVLQCAAIEKEVVGNRHSWYANTAFIIYYCYYNLRDFANALKYIRECTEINELVKGRHSDEFVNALYYQAMCYKGLGNYAEALRLNQEVAVLVAEKWGKESPDYAAALGRLATSYYELCDYAESIRLNTEVLAVLEATVGKEHVYYASTLNNLALGYTALAKYEEAIHFYTEALPLVDKLYGKMSSEYATLLNNMATILSKLDSYEAALLMNTEAKDIRAQILGTNSLEYAISLNSLASNHRDLGNYDKALPLYKESVEIIEHLYGKKHTYYASGINDLGMCHFRLGNYDEALRLVTEALNIRGESGKENSNYAASLGNLAEIYASQANHTEAIRLYAEALDIQEKTLGKMNQNYAAALCNMAESYAALGNYGEAIRRNTEALSILASIVGKMHSGYAKVLSGLASNYSDSGNHEEAIRLQTEALNIMEKTMGKTHLEISGILVRLAGDYIAIGNVDEAVRLYTEAADILTKKLGRRHSGYASLLQGMALCRFKQGNYQEAIRLTQGAIEIGKKALGESHPSYAWSIITLAMIYYFDNQGEKAIDEMVKGTNLITAELRSNFADLTAEERNLFWNQNQAYLEVFPHQYAYRFTSDSLAANGYNCALVSKGLLLNSELEFSRLIQESGDAEALRLYDELRGYRILANKQMEKMQTTANTDSLRAIVDSLNAQADVAEKALLEKSKIYGDYTHNLVITWPQVQAQLGEKDVAVEFVSFPYEVDSTMYVAYVLRKDGQPQMVPLFEEKTLTALSRKDKDAFDYGYCESDAVSRMVWSPLAELLRGAENVYFAASGELHNIPVEALPDWESAGHFMNEKYKFHRLSSTRELALIKDHNDWHDAAVYGGLLYGADEKDFEAHHDRYAVKKRDFDFGTAFSDDSFLGYNIADSIAVMRAEDKLPQYLEGTMKEAVDITMSLKMAKVDATLYSDSLGTEASFKDLSGQRMNVMHIGTHGFFASKRQTAQRSDNTLLDGMLAGNRTAHYTEDYALTRSGLLFAGANFALSGNALPEGVENGILTANEISALDLRGLDLVVLSACQTGLGEVSGEGVFGLQRGFKKAGAQTLVMSLWKVDDTATQLFMTRFFQNLSGLSMDKYAAFAEAQDYLRHYETTVAVSPSDAPANSPTAADRLKPKGQREEEAKKSAEQSAANAQPETRTVRPFDAPKYWASFILLDAAE